MVSHDVWLGTLMMAWHLDYKIAYRYLSNWPDVYCQLGIWACAEDMVYADP